MKYIIRFLGIVWKGLIAWKQFVPVGLMGLFLASTWIYNIFTIGFMEATKELAFSFFVAERTINKAVTLAVNNSPEYGFYQLWAVLSSVFIIYYFAKWMGKIFEKWMGAQAGGPALLFGLLFVAIIECIGSVTLFFTEGVVFIPIVHGVGFFFFNIGPVFSNVHMLGYRLAG